MLGLTPDMVLATAAAGQSVVFYPMVVRNWRRHYCHFPLYISTLKIAFLVLSFVGFVLAGLPMASIVVAVDVGAWVVLAIQRQAWGDGTVSADSGKMARSLRCRFRLHEWGNWHPSSTVGPPYVERHCYRCLVTQNK